MTFPQDSDNQSRFDAASPTHVAVLEAALAPEGRRLANVDPARGWAFRVSRAGLIGLGVSLILHSLILTVFAVVTIASGGGGGRSLIGAPVEVAIVDSAEVVSLNEGPVTADAPGVDEVKGMVDLAPMPVVNVAGGNGLTDAGDLGGNMGTGLGGAGAGTGIGIGDGSGGSGAGGTSFFGVEARGLRFAFVVDVSGSMDGEKLDYLKRELAKAIDRLGETASFVVLCFDSETRPLIGTTKLLPAIGKNKKSALEAIGALRAGGGTEPMPALSAALRNRPRPDAIYFMTDGLFDATVVESLRGELRGGRNVPVHCISFIDRSSEALMRRIAQMSDGSYTHVDGTGTPPARNGLPPGGGRRRP
ncbi:MAG: VWA domain-containing protein [Phycisphaerales bacterium]|nr:VWA domain-containing protein [Phycisphaerales bacterium]